MSLKYKIAIIALVFFVCYGIIDYSILRIIILQSFVTLEQKEADQNLERCVSAIQRELYHLDKLCFDWSSWDDTYEFVQNPSDDYIKSNLIIDQFNPDLFNLIYIVNADGDLVWGGIRNAEMDDSIQLTAFDKKKFTESDPLIRLNPYGKPSGGMTNAGIIITEKGPMLICARPILTSNNEGPMAGTLLMGRFLTDSVIKTLTEQTRVAFGIVLMEPTPSNSRYKAIVEHFAHENSFYLEEKDDHLMMYAPYYDISRKLAFVVTTKFPRQITKKGFLTIHFAIFSILIAGCIVLLAMLASMQTIILKPISKLTNFVVAVEKDRDFSLRVKFRRKDEIGTLANGLNSMVQTIAEQTDLLISANLTLQNLSAMDGLTGIANRRRFDEVVEIEWRRMIREKTFLSLILCDLDFFKPFNDHYGHQAGDSCLKKVANAIKNTLNRSSDMAARYGGEEFVVILPNTDIQGAEHIAESIRKAIENLNIEHVKSHAAAHVTLSLGVSSVIPSPDLSIEHLIGTADSALYLAKHQGRNQVVTQT